MSAILFILGLAVGSFLNVLIARYAPREFLLSSRVVGGRSHCMACGRTLRSFELIPLVSYALQFGRCRTCRAWISVRYPLVELVSALVFVFVPRIVAGFYFLNPSSRTMLDILWILVFLTLLVLSAIDMRFTIIPDEASIFLGLLGVAIAYVSFPLFGLTGGSLVGPYALLFGFRGNIVGNRLFALFVALLIFAVLYFVTRGRGMGFGDVKLTAALSLVFGWPDVLVLIIIAFITGSLVGAGLILGKRARLKGFLPFGPFLALSAFVVFFWGEQILAWYFNLARL